LQGNPAYPEYGAKRRKKGNGGVRMLFSMLNAINNILLDYTEFTGGFQSLMPKFCKKICKIMKAGCLKRFVFRPCGGENALLCNVALY